MTAAPDTHQPQADDLSDMPAELVPVKVQAAPLRQKIVAALRQAIEVGTLKAGDRLIEKELCAKLNVSRTSLREALRDLEANGVITNVSVRGLIVTPLSREDIVSIHRVRRAIEALLAEQFIRWATDEDVAGLRAALDRMRAAASSSTATMEAQRDYYQALSKGARNRFAFEIMMNMQLRLSIVRSSTARQPEFRQQNIEGKAAILSCLEKRDLPGAQAAVLSHLKSATAAAVRGVEEASVPDRSAAAR